MTQNIQDLQDQDTLHSLESLSEKENLQQNLIPNVRTILVVLSSHAMVFDLESLRQKLLLAYPDAAVFFISTSGKPLGVAAPKQVDLLIDFTGPGERQGWFYAMKLRKMAGKVAGRNAGLFRKRLYDRIVDEKNPSRKLPLEFLDRERIIQKEVLAQVGVAFIAAGEPTEDRAKLIALDLPRLQKK